MLSSKLDNNINIVMDDIAVKSTDCLELLGVSIDRQLRFDEHIQRVGVLMRLRNLIPTGTKLQLCKAVIFPYLTYSHLDVKFI